MNKKSPKISELEKRIKLLEEQNEILKTSLQDDLQYRDFVNHLTDYIYTVYVKDGEALQTVHGPGCVAVTGYKSADFEDDPELWYNMVFKADRTKVTRQASNALAGKKVHPLEHRLIHRDGSVRWVRNTIVHQYDKNGILVAYNGLITDITAHKIADEKMRVSEEKYRSLINDVLDSARGAIIISDKNLNIVWVNSAFEIFFGVERQDVIGRKTKTVLTHYLQPLFQHSEAFADKILEIYKSKKRSDSFECNMNGDGLLKNRNLQYWTQPIRTGLYKNGRIEHYTDITEHNVILEEVVETERRFRQLINHLTDYVYTVKVVNGKPAETFHGHGSLGVTGYTQEDFAINPELWIEMVVEEDRPAVREHAQKPLLGISTPPLEHRIKHRDGSIHWVRSTIVIQKNENGDVVSYDGLINDITPLKKAAELDKLRQQQLVQADKMVTLGILISGVAHEINNPNNFILLNNNMLNKMWASILPILEEYYNEHGDFGVAGMPYSVAQEKIVELIDGVRKGSDRIQKIVSGLKDFARQDSGDLNQKVNVNKVVDAAITIMNNLIKKSVDDFSTKLKSPLPLVKGNFQKLEQVIINLINNACLALENSEKKLSIKTEYNSKTECVVLRVADTGIGISEDSMKHIIDPFFTTRREMGGTGLGLSIAYNIISDHGGKIDFESKVGKGTTVTITLPVDKQESVV